MILNMSCLPAKMSFNCETLKKQIQKAHSHPTTSTQITFGCYYIIVKDSIWAAIFRCQPIRGLLKKEHEMGIYVYRWTCWKEIDVYLPDACFSLSTLNNWLSMDLKPWWHKSPEPQRQTISSVFPVHHLGTTINPPSKPYSCYHIVIINITSEKRWPIAPSTASEFWQMHVKL